VFLADSLLTGKLNLSARVTEFLSLFSLSVVFFLRDYCSLFVYSHLSLDDSSPPLDDLCPTLDDSSPLLGDPRSPVDGSRPPVDNSRPLDDSGPP
jgi:hypothetical protein